MIRPRKVKSIALFEFLCNVKRKGYLITTFGMPVFLMLYGLVMSVPAYFSAKKDAETKVFGVIDHAGILGLTGDESFGEIEIPAEVRSVLERTGQHEALDQAMAFQGSSVFRPFDDEQAAREALLGERIRGYYVLPADFVERGEVSSYYRESISTGGSSSRRHLETLIRDRLLADHIPEELMARASDPVAKFHNWMISADGEVHPRDLWGVIARLVVPLVFAIMMIVSILGSAGYLIQGTAIEKENKVVEVLLSSANPQEILTGKLLGLAAVGLLQVTVWFSMLIVAGVIFASTLTALGVNLPWSAIAVALAFFLMGYLFLGSLMLGTGSIGSNQRESQQWSAIWIILTVAPMMLMMMFFEDPAFLGAKIMTWIPFTAPLTVILRMTLSPDGIAWWEIAGSFAVLAASTYLALQLGARLFRVGLLLTGARPKLREIWRQARLG